MFSMTNHWRHPIAVILASAFFVNAITSARGAYASGIPVVDGASISDRAIKHAESMGKYLEQIAVLKDQLDSQRRQLESLTGTRNLGDILNNPSIRAALPTDARKLLRSVDEGDFQDIVKRIEREERLTGHFETDRKNLDLRAEQLAFRSQALIEQTQTAMTARMTQVGQLQGQINQMHDPKAIADLQARLLVEQANIQADQARADLLMRQLEAEQTLMQTQADKLAAQSFSIEAIRAPLPGAR